VLDWLNWGWTPLIAVVALSFAVFALADEQLLGTVGTGVIFVISLIVLVIVMIRFTRNREPGP
jgi:uncharacterized membrane protein (DUF2068 family)